MKNESCWQYKQTFSDYDNTQSQLQRRLKSSRKSKEFLNGCNKKDHIWRKKERPQDVSVLMTQSMSVRKGRSSESLPIPLHPLSKIPLTWNPCSNIPSFPLYDHKVCSYPYWVIQGRETLLSDA
jgi:hypothetical protein